MSEHHPNASRSRSRHPPAAARYLAAFVSVLAAACGDEGPPPPALIQPASTPAQQGTVGQPVETAPAVVVRDGAGNLLPGVRVSFSVVAGGGSVANATATSDAMGRASAGTWTLGTQVGENAVEAVVGSLARPRFTATAGAGPAASMTAVQGDDQMAVVGSPVPIVPTVRVEDAFGNPAQGTVVSFQATVGGGEVDGGNRAAGADGTAAPLAWRLGFVAGPNALTASAQGLPSIVFDATSERGPARILSRVAGDGQVAPPGTPVAVPPQVLVSDSFFNPVAGATVTFEVEIGDATLGGAVVATGADGVATLGSWTLGDDLEHTLLASADSVPGSSVSFRAVTAATSEYDIALRFETAVTDAQRLAFELARSLWRSAITGDVPAIDLVDAGCPINGAVLNETVDDLLIFARVEPIDGPGGILGEAGPCLVRSAGLLPIVGAMRFDEADLAALEDAGLLDEVVVHEMGHVLGIGTLWSALGLLTGAGTGDPFFTGSEAIQGFLDVGGASYAGDPVPVENTGAAGTRDAHWRESVFDNELMTGFIDGGVPNPLSVVSLASLIDLGYLVDLGAAQGYVLPPPALAAARAASGTRIELVEGPLPPPVIVP